MNFCSKETNNILNDWIQLISNVSNIAYLILTMIQNNFFKYHYSGKNHHELQLTLFKYKKHVEKMKSEKAEINEKLLTV